MFEKFLNWSIFKKMQEGIADRVSGNKPGLSVAILFPVMLAFLLTFGISRLISIYFPNLSFITPAGLHIHHFTYGIFILAVSSYLALIYNGVRAKFLISLLFGVGLGLAFDEFGMWLKLSGDDIARWEYDGFNIIIGLVILILAFRPGMKLIHTIFSKKSEK